MGIANHCQTVAVKVGNQWRHSCPRCGRPVTIDTREYVRRCTHPCQNLGELVERNGVVDKVKCGCSGKLKDQYHASYRCSEHLRALPTLRLNETQRAEWEERKPESDIYHACDGCKEYEPCLT